MGGSLLLSYFHALSGHPGDPEEPQSNGLCPKGDAPCPGNRDRQHVGRDGGAQILGIMKILISRVLYS